MPAVARFGLLLIGTGAVLLLGCGPSAAPIEPSVSALVGTWVGDTLRHEPRGLTAITLTFSASGRVEFAVRTSGLYPGQARTDLTGQSRYVGRVAASGPRLAFQFDSLYSSDASAREVGQSVAGQRNLGGGTDPFDQATYMLQDDRLTLSYLSYPADAPVPTIARFVRA